MRLTALLLIPTLFFNSETVKCSKCNRDGNYYEKWNGSTQKLLETFTIHKRKEPLNDDSPFGHFNSYNSTFYVTREDNRPSEPYGRKWNFELELVPREVSVHYYHYESTGGCLHYVNVVLENGNRPNVLYCDHRETGYCSAEKQVVELSVSKVRAVLSNDISNDSWTPELIEKVVSSVRTGKLLKIRGRLNMELKGESKEAMLKNLAEDGLWFYIDSIEDTN